MMPARNDIIGERQLSTDIFAIQRGSSQRPWTNLGMIDQTLLLFWTASSSICSNDEVELVSNFA